MKLLLFFLFGLALLVRDVQSTHFRITDDYEK
jgi:hypothetical protein